MGTIDSDASKMPIKVTVQRIQNVFEFTNPYLPENCKDTIIKNYVYSQERRIIA